MDREPTENSTPFQDLISTQEQLDIFFTYAPDAIFINNLQGTIVEVNDTAQVLFGYSRDELLGKTFGELKFFPRNQIRRMERELAKIAMGESTGPEIFIVNHKNGNKVSIEMMAYPATVKKAALVLYVLRDISKRISEKQERIKLQEQLRQTQKMDAIGRLAGGIAHDFNNMLGTISGYADIILKRFAPDNPKVEKYALGIYEAAKKSADLTAKLLAFAQKGQYETGPIDIHVTVQNVVDVMKHSFDESIAITKDFTASHSVVFGDKSQMQNIILNLVMNAKDAMPKGGTLELVTKNIQLDALDILNRAEEIKPGSYLKLSVSDTGVGMDEEVKFRAFEPFFTTKDLGQATGLGLAGVYGIVKAHGGFIEIKSEIDSGTQFDVYLPLAKEEIDESSEESPKEEQAVGGKILLVDDEELFREMTTEMIEGMGYDIETCSDGDEAIEYFKDHSQEVDLVILDVIMKRVGGYDCFVALQKIDPSVKAIITSGYSSDGEAKKILEKGAIGFLQKPFEMDKLSEVIAKNVGKSSS